MSYVERFSYFFYTNTILKTNELQVNCNCIFLSMIKITCVYPHSTYSISLFTVSAEWLALMEQMIRLRVS